jgi:excinuclease UvrABC nuclease subunit
VRKKIARVAHRVRLPADGLETTNNEGAVMGKHTFNKDVIASAKAKGKALIAVAFRGHKHDASIESPVHDETGSAIAMFAIGVIEGKTEMVDRALVKLGIQKEVQ